MVMNKRPQKRYTSERAILADIYKLEREATALLKEIHELNSNHKTLFRECSDLHDKAENASSDQQAKELHEQANLMGHNAELSKAEAIKKNVTRENILNQHLPRLGQALAAFRTGTFEFVGSDKGVTI